MQRSGSPPIGLLVAAVRSASRCALLAQIGPLGLSTRQFWALVGVSEHPGSSQCELAAALHWDEPTASRVMRSLQARGFVRTVREPEDRRRVRVGLTERGTALTRQLLPVARRIREAVEEPLTRDERERTRAALGKIVAHLERLAAAGTAGCPPVRLASGGRT